MNLKKCDTFDLTTLKGPSDYLAAANSTETTEKIELCMKGWIKQIEQVRPGPSGIKVFYCYLFTVTDASNSAYREYSSLSRTRRA